MKSGGTSAKHHICAAKIETEKADTKLDIRQATASYETWLRGCTTVVDCGATIET